MFSYHCSLTSIIAICQKLPVASWSSAGKQGHGMYLCVDS